MRSRVSLVALVAGSVIGGAVATAAASPISFSRPIPIKPPRGLAAIRSWGGASCPSASLCVATDGTPRIVTSTDPTGGRRAWTLGAIGSSGYITGISCPSTSLCVATGADDLRDGFYVSTDPAGGAATWSFGWTPLGYGPEDVSCASVTLCVAADGSGNVFTSTDPAAGAQSWSFGLIDPHANSLQAVSCPSESLCVAVDVDGAIFASTDPAAGASTWHRTRRSGGHEGWFDVSCPSARLCVASGSGFEVSRDPARAGSWHHVPEPPNGDQIKGITGISCASARLCVAADLSGLVFVSTDPTGGVHAWHVVRVHRLTRSGANVRVACSHSRRPVCVVAATASEWVVVGHVRSARRHRRR
ncbi:MAG TPA: hypothetical protein VMB27_16885 [Solirubrobacteraceae bacterium]|nr:hypothetical protein [Solirubrobacteraceae bacterium]